MSPLLAVHDLTYAQNGEDPILSSLELTVEEGDIVCIQGPSGAGKSTLLKCLAHLNPYEGQVLLRGMTPKSYGVPLYRTRVSYVPQRPSLLPGSPHDFLLALRSLKARKNDRHLDLQNPVNVAHKWGIDPHLWERDWSSLSGGESQRIALAIAVGLATAEVLLLDEPTSALDPASSILVEEYLVDTLSSAQTSLKAILWITHAEEQASRVGTRFVHIADGGCFESACSSGQN